MISATMLWMNKVSFALEENFDNYMLAGMRTLFKLYGKSGNAPRQFIVANCCRDLTGKEPTGLFALKSAYFDGEGVWYVFFCEIFTRIAVFVK